MKLPDGTEGGQPDGGQLALGHQETIEFYDCASSVLADCRELERIFLRAAECSGATVVKSFFHQFAPQGVSGVVIISESHFAVHAWPEHDYAAVDLFTCGETIDFDRAVAEITAGLHARRVIVSGRLHRGFPGNDGEARSIPLYGVTEPARYPLSWAEYFQEQQAFGISFAADFIGVRPERAEPLVGEDEFWRDLGLSPAGGAESDGRGQWRRALTDGGWLLLRLRPADEVVNLDGFHIGFVDPRRVAEAVQTRLGSRNYRLQAALRQ